jgi:hypothetical protein
MTNRFLSVIPSIKRGIFLQLRAHCDYKCAITTHSCQRRWAMLHENFFLKMAKRTSGISPQLLASVGCLFLLSACAAVSGPTGDGQALRQTATLIQEVKAFGKHLGIEPTEALSRTAEQRPSLSMLWLWLQRDGTLALRAPIDIRMAIGFSNDKDQLQLEQVYRVAGYSVYYRQGNEFADQRSVATMGFAMEGIVRRVMVILHEDLHGDNNFDLPWEIEESIVTPLGVLGTVEFFRQKGDDENFKRALATVEEQKKYSRELNALAEEAEKILQREAPEPAKKTILELIPKYPTYNRQFQRQITGQHPPTALEAKLSHDLAYYKYFDRIAALSEKAPDLKTLIIDFKKLPHDASHEDLERYLQRLDSQYPTATK